MRARFINGTFEVSAGMQVRTNQNYDGVVEDPTLFPTICVTHTEYNQAPKDEVRNLPEETIEESFYDVLVVRLQEKTIGELGLLNEFKIPVEHLIKI